MILTFLMLVGDNITTTGMEKHSTDPGLWGMV